MSQLVFIDNNQVFTDSLTVAEVFGKRHDVVLRDIRNLECSQEFNLHNFAEIDYTDERNRTYKKYLIKRDGLAFLVFGYTGAKAAEYKEKYIQAFNSMEEELRKPKILTDHQQRIELLKLSLEHEEKFVEYEERRHYKKVQYTGLKDKNGVEIYEGDILGKEYHWSFYIGFNDGCFVMIPCDSVQRANWTWHPVGQQMIKGWKVIGNIYQNPELLERGE